MTLLTESSDEDMGAVGGMSSIILLASSAAEKSADSLTRHVSTLDTLALASSDSDNDDNMNRQNDYSVFGGIDDTHAEDLPASGENLIEYSEVVVPATRSYSAAVEEAGVLLNLLEDVQASSSPTSHSSGSMLRSSFGGGRQGLKSEC